MASTTASSSSIRVRGARTNNLRDIDVDIPKRSLVVITGLSGSGKSSLAIDTVFAESQRQYLESQSLFARQFFDQSTQLDVDRIEGLPPAICINQKRGTPNPRSTVGTLSDLYDFLRLLMARVGEVRCPNCHQRVSPQSATEICEMLESWPERTKVVIMAPLVRGRKGRHEKVIDQIRSERLVRARVDGRMLDIDSVPVLDQHRDHTIEAVTDRVIIRDGISSRLLESVRAAARIAGGLVQTSYLLPDTDQWRDQLFNTNYACAECETSVPEIEPRSFSFNSPWGACPDCSGTGLVAMEADDSESADAEFTRTKCSSCDGSRLNKDARAVILGGKAIHEICALEMGEAKSYFESLQFAGNEKQIAEPLIVDIVRRLEFLILTRLEYLSLDRSSDSLSGGELQRVRLAAAIGSGLSGACYVLDEPTTGLHPRDTQRLIEAFKMLVARGNSVLVVEHDHEVIMAADHVIDVGPGAGSNGGKLVAEGTPQQIQANANSSTGQFLAREANRRDVARVADRKESPRGPGRQISLRGASGFNLKQVDIDFPLGRLNCVTGVSGSGKSTLIQRTLTPAVRQHLGLKTDSPAPFQSIEGLDAIEQIVSVTQRPISRSPRGCAATYTGLLDELRKVFAATRLARQRGYKPSRFSFNSKVGWCSNCEGYGVRQISMKFMADLEVTCEVCRGQRYNAATLEVRFRERSIADVLAMPVADALDEFAAIPKVHALLRSLSDVGLGYLPLGQRSTTLSGGEAQRIRLAKELARPDSGDTLYLLDEPTTGLHFDDIGRLVQVLKRLVAKGNTMIVIEHNVDLIRAADWVIDLGPEAGRAGGNVVACGTPDEIGRHSESQIAPFL